MNAGHTAESDERYGNYSTILGEPSHRSIGTAVGGGERAPGPQSAEALVTNQKSLNLC